MDDVLSLIRAVAPPTPIERLELEGLGPILLKREDLGPNATFKWRGAIAAVESYRQGGADGVVTASTGNHGAAVAWAAARLGLIADVVVPRNAVARKCELIAAHGARLHQIGDGLDEASEHAVHLAAQTGRPYFEDGSSAAQLAGAGTIGDELAAVEDLAAVFVPVACGALAAGLSGAFQDAANTPRLVGVQSKHFSRMTARFHGRSYSPTAESTFADGLADDRLVEPAFSICMECLDDLVSVDEEQLRAAVRRLWTAAEIRAEGAGAAALAGLMACEDVPTSGSVVVIVSGGNLDPRDAREILGGAAVA